MKEESSLINIPVAALIDSPYDKFPVPGEDRSPERNRISYLPTKPVRKFLPRDGRLTVPQKSRFLIRRDNDLRVYGQVMFGLHGIIREEILLINIDPPKPGAVGD